MDPTSAIKTPQTHPDHSTVGHYFAGHSFGTSRAELYFCDSYDPRIGYWLTNVSDPADRKNVSERAIGGTYHEAHQRDDYWWVSCWNIKLLKADLAERAAVVREELRKAYAHLDTPALEGLLVLRQEEEAKAGSRCYPLVEIPRIQAEIARRTIG